MYGILGEIFMNYLRWFWRKLLEQWHNPCVRWFLFLRWENEGGWIAIDKIAHFVGHAGFYTLCRYFKIDLGFAYFGAMTMVQAISWTLVLGIGIELYQRFFSFWKEYWEPGWGMCSRGVSFKDLVADYLGMGLGIWLDMKNLLKVV